jgi:hypothetical protein
MDISEIRTKRKALEKHLTAVVGAALSEFQTETGVAVEGVDIDVTHLLVGGMHVGHIGVLNKVRVQLEHL